MEKLIHHVWDTNTYKVITGFESNFCQRRITDHGMDHWILWKIQIEIRIQDPDYYPDRSPEVCIF